MSLNVKLLRRVRDKILKEPLQFEMSQWYTLALDHPIPNCGTAACIAGWAIALAEKKSPAACYDTNNIQGKAMRLLGIEDDPWKLFAVSSWPIRYQNQFYNTGSLKVRARIAARRIDAYIKEQLSK